MSGSKKHRAAYVIFDSIFDRMDKSFRRTACWYFTYSKAKSAVQYTMYPKGLKSITQTNKGTLLDLILLWQKQIVVYVHINGVCLLILRKVSQSAFTSPSDLVSIEGSRNVVKTVS